MRYQKNWVGVVLCSVSSFWLNNFKHTVVMFLLKLKCLALQLKTKSADERNNHFVFPAAYRTSSYCSRKIITLVTVSALALRLYVIVTARDEHHQDVLVGWAEISSPVCKKLLPPQDYLYRTELNLQIFAHKSSKELTNHLHLKKSMLYPSLSSKLPVKNI